MTTSSPASVPCVSAHTFLMPDSHTSSRALLYAVMVLLACSLLAAATFIVQRIGAYAAFPATSNSGPLLLAPLVGVNDTCIELASGAAALPGRAEASPAQTCSASAGSAAPLIEATLAQLLPVTAEGHKAGNFVLGYTLAVPLLTLFERGPGGWQIDTERLTRVTRTLAQSQRPAVLYLFSTHFSAGSELETELAADSRNLAYTRDGPLPTSRYYGAPLYNWSVARTNNPLTQRRDQAMAAVLAALCQLPDAQRARVKAITLMGETHQLFPDFEAGMGFAHPYHITDYSAASVQGFQAYLRQQFGTLAQLNRSFGSDYASFGDVMPPSRDIRAEPLQRYTEHLDAFAHGTLPVAGWAYVPPSAARQAATGAAPWVHVFRNGVFIAKVRADRGRQDVAQAVPQVQGADTGWRFDLDFRHLTPGLHRIDVFLEQRPGELTAIGSRQIAIMDARQQTPTLGPQQTLPRSVPMRGGVRAHLDQPTDQASYYFNPLVPFWHAFRNQQVADYLAHFSQQVGRSCLARVPRYTHQIVPFSNPGWDANKFAIDQSLQTRGSLRLGVSLYGDAAYGARFAAWLRATGDQRYGVTEFHPLRALNPQQLRSVLNTHAADGAQFLSFFLEPRWQGALVPRAAHNPFSLDPDNPEFGSDVLYQSMQQILRQPASQTVRPAPGASPAHP